MNFYNEIDPKAAAALRLLIERGLIAPGIVDTRSIVDIKPYELTSYTQCHFFCGEAGWPLALELAGWPRGKRVWTGSCPCQPFSLGGNREGEKDERHLWPAFHHLISECGPPAVFGEQVEAAVSLGWLDGVGDDLEKEGYAFGSGVLRAGALGAPHERPRLYWGAFADSFSQGGEGLEPCGSAGALGSWGLCGPEDLQSLCDTAFEPGDRWPQPLLRRMDDGLFGRVDQLRIHGNAIVPHLAARFILAATQAFADLKNCVSPADTSPLRRPRRR